MFNSGSSPYVKNSGRLADVIAAIQAMGVYEFHMCEFNIWAERISGSASKADYWKRVFEEHPEFFRLDTTRMMASLVWRRQLPKDYHVDLKRRLLLEEQNALPQAGYQRLTRAPLAAPDIKALIDTAVNLHARAVELQREGRWWVPLISNFVSGVVGGLIVVFFKHG